MPSENIKKGFFVKQISQNNMDVSCVALWFSGCPL
jgi:hypothetical protein